MLLSSLLLLLATTADADLCKVMDNQCHADGFASHYAIGDVASDHIRVFQSAGLVDQNQAWLVLPAAGTTSDKHSANLTIVLDDEAFSALSALARLEASDVSCSGVKDGVGYIIDGYIKGLRFTLSARNPHRCDTIGARTVASALDLLRASRAGFYPETTDGCEGVGSFKPCPAVFRPILRLSNRSTCLSRFALADTRLEACMSSVCPVAVGVRCRLVRDDSSDFKVGRRA
jgi:hypothetical protein